MRLAFAGGTRTPSQQRITPSRIALSPGYGDKTKAVPARHGRRAKVAVKIRGDNRHAHLTKRF